MLNSDSFTLALTNTKNSVYIPNAILTFLLLEVFDGSLCFLYEELLDILKGVIFFLPAFLLSHKYCWAAANAPLKAEIIHNQVV